MKQYFGTTGIRYFTEVCYHSDIQVLSIKKLQYSNGIFCIEHYP